MWDDHLTSLGEGIEIYPPTIDILINFFNLYVNLIGKVYERTSKQITFTRTS